MLTRQVGLPAHFKLMGYMLSIGGAVTNAYKSEIYLEQNKIFTIAFGDTYLYIVLFLTSDNEFSGDNL